MFTDMENWAEIRRRVLVDGLSKRAACREYRHPLEDPQARSSPTPSRPAIAAPGPRPRPKLEPLLPVVHQILEDDRKAPRKQRHTAERIFERLRDEHGYEGGLTVVKDAVRAWRAPHAEVFVPLAHPPGEAQADFGEAEVTLDGRPAKVAVFVMTLPYSDAIFCCAFPRECTEAFLEGHVRAFAFFGGVPRRISYDNLKIAVAKITGSRQPRRSPTSSSGWRATTSSRPTSAWCGGPTRRGTSRRSSATPAATSSCRSPCVHGGLEGAQRPARGRLPRRPGAAAAGQAGDQGRAAGRGAGGAAAAAGRGVRGRAGRAAARRLAVAGPLRHQRLLGADRVRPPPGHGRRDGRRGPHRRRRPRRGGPPPVLGPRGGLLRPGPLPGPAGAQARRPGLRRPAGGLGAAGLLRRPAAAARGRVRRAGDAAVHQGPAAARGGEPARS